MTHPAILGRAFNREIINLGFSGNGKMEPEVTRFFAELNPAVFILDCLPKMNDTEVHERTAHRQRNESNHAALGEEFAKLQAEKVPQLYYLKADNLLSSDGEGTIHSSHPTDLGFTRQAAEVERVLRQIPSLA